MFDNDDNETLKSLGTEGVDTVSAFNIVPLKDVVARDIVSVLQHEVLATIDSNISDALLLSDKVPHMMLYSVAGCNARTTYANVVEFNFRIPFWAAIIFMLLGRIAESAYTAQAIAPLLSDTVPCIVREYFELVALIVRILGGGANSVNSNDSTRITLL